MCSVWRFRCECVKHRTTEMAMNGIYCSHLNTPYLTHYFNKLCSIGRHNIPPPLQVDSFDLLTLKVVSESRATWATSVSAVLVFLGLSVLGLASMCATDRQTSDRQTSDAHHRLMHPPYGGGA